MHYSSNSHFCGLRPVRLKKFLKTNFIDAWGHKPLCDHVASRAPQVGNFCFPLCWRCISIIVGLLFSRLFLTNAHIPIYVGLLLLLPAFVDSVKVHFFHKESVNIILIFTGIPAGIGMHLIVNAVFP